MNSEALYKRIAAGLRQQITSGHLPPGAAIPAGLELARRYSAARDTVGKALRELQAEGLITGGLVKTVAHHDRIPISLHRDSNGWAGEAPTAGADSWGHAIEAAGRVPSQRIDVLMARAESPEAARLGISPGDLVCVRRLIRYADGEPHNMITFWFPYGIIADHPQLSHPESIAEGSIAWLEKQLGPLEHTWESWPRPPTPDEAEILRIPPGVSVEETWRTSTAAGRPVAVSRAIYPGDRTKLTG